MINKNLKNLISMPVLKLQEVSWVASIGSALLLQNISFSVHRGEKIALVGASGAGKTTLLRLLNRLNNPTQGNIYFQGQPLEQMPANQLRQAIALIPQEPKLLGMTVTESLAYPLQLQKLANAEIDRRVDTWRNRLRIPETWLNRTELQLSLGQRQLVAIARSLVMQPQIILLDEPTSALDLGIAQHLLMVLDDLSQNHNVTIIMVNHQLELIENFAHRILYLATGILTEDMAATATSWLQVRQKLLAIQQHTEQEWS